MLRVFIGLVVPYLGVLALMPWAASVSQPVFGIPFIYFWIFCWFAMTSGCLSLCYALFDSRTGERL